jgi:diadenosine tetraphosphate (Ap4A) HIT family hydrolase
MATWDAAEDCFVCRKHCEQGPLLPGGPAAEDDLIVVAHLSPEAPGRDGGPVYLGHLLVEPKRHAPGLGDLTDTEARALGLWCARASRALREVARAEHVYAAVIGDRTQHLHVHLLPRYPGTPRKYWWDGVDEWPDARRGMEPEISMLVADLRAYLNAAETG